MSEITIVESGKRIAEREDKEGRRREEEEEEEEEEERGRGRKKQMKETARGVKEGKTKGTREE